MFEPYLLRLRAGAEQPIDVHQGVATMRVAAGDAHNIVPLPADRQAKKKVFPAALPSFVPLHIDPLALRLRRVCRYLRVRRRSLGGQPNQLEIFLPITLQTKRG